MYANVLPRDAPAHVARRASGRERLGRAAARRDRARDERAAPLSARTSPASSALADATATTWDPDDFDPDENPTRCGATTAGRAQRCRPSGRPSGRELEASRQRTRFSAAAAPSCSITGVAPRRQSRTSAATSDAASSRPARRAGSRRAARPASPWVWRRRRSRPRPCAFSASVRNIARSAWPRRGANSPACPSSATRARRRVPAGLRAEALGAAGVVPMTTRTRRLCGPPSTRRGSCWIWVAAAEPGAEKLVRRTVRAVGARLPTRWRGRSRREWRGVGLTAAPWPPSETRGVRLVDASLEQPRVLHAGGTLKERDGPPPGARSLSLWSARGEKPSPTGRRSRWGVVSHPCQVHLAAAFAVGLSCATASRIRIVALELLLTADDRYAASRLQPAPVVRRNHRRRRRSRRAARRAAIRARRGDDVRDRRRRPRAAATTRRHEQSTARRRPRGVKPTARGAEIARPWVAAGRGSCCSR